MESEFAVSFLDGFPITQGHSLVIPKRHVASLFELTEVEQVAVWKLVSQVRALLAAELQPDGLYPSGERPLDTGPEVIGLSRFSAFVIRPIEELAGRTGARCEGPPSG
jgi:hypothetical protein